MKIVFTALSKHNFYFKDFITKYVLDKDCVPLNPFMLFNYFMLDTVERDRVRAANNELVRKADELWVFGEISDGVLKEIKLAESLKKPIKYYKILDSKNIKEISKNEIEFEEGIKLL